MKQTLTSDIRRRSSALMLLKRTRGADVAEQFHSSDDVFGRRRMRATIWYACTQHM